jgi:hypothetical protein
MIFLATTLTPQALEQIFVPAAAQLREFTTTDSWPNVFFVNFRL